MAYRRNIASPSNQWLTRFPPASNFPGPFLMSVPESHVGIDPSTGGR